VANNIKCFREVEGIDDDIRVEIEKVGYSMKEVDKSSSGATCWLESKRITRTEGRRGRKLRDKYNM